MRASRSTLLLAGFLAAAVLRSAVAMVPTVKTVELLEHNTDLRAALSADRVAAIYGGVIDSATVPGEYATVRAFVADFLANEGDVLGVEGAQFEFVDEVNIRDNKFAVVTYRQLIQSLPVHASIARVLVLLGPTEQKITYIGMHLTELPADPLPSQNDITAQAAIDLVDLSAEYEPVYGHLIFTDAQDVTNVVYEAPDGTAHRCWRFEGWVAERSEAYRFLVDTSSGVGLVGVEDLVFEFDGTLMVEGTGEFCCHPGRPDWPQCCPTGLPDCCCEETDVDYPECAYKCCGRGMAFAALAW